MVYLPDLNLGWMAVNGLLSLEVSSGKYFHHEKDWWKNLSPLMQFTGLLDKKGKEIYEGDIVSYGPGRNFSVEYAVKYGCWYVVPCGDYENNAPLGKSEKACEVIGNIYQNPELLR